MTQRGFNALPAARRFAGGTVRSQPYKANQNHPQGRDWNATRARLFKQ